MHWRRVLVLGLLLGGCVRIRGGFLGDVLFLGRWSQHSAASEVAGHNGDTGDKIKGEPPFGTSSATNVDGPTPPT